MHFNLDLSNFCIKQNTPKLTKSYKYGVLIVFILLYDKNDTSFNRKFSKSYLEDVLNKKLPKQCKQTWRW